MSWVFCPPWVSEKCIVLLLFGSNAWTWQQGPWPLCFTFAGWNGAEYLTDLCKHGMCLPLGISDVYTNIEGVLTAGGRLFAAFSAFSIIWASFSSFSCSRGLDVFSWYFHPEVPRVEIHRAPSRAANCTNTNEGRIKAGACCYCSCDDARCVWPQWRLQRCGVRRTLENMATSVSLDSKKNTKT